MKSVIFDNGRGFALGFDEAAPSPFVTWQFTETENGQKDYYWGHYHSSGQTAEKDFAKRVSDYKELFGVHERTEGHEQAEYYRYYSTQRPVDLGTFPKPPGNAPVEIINFDERRMVEGGTMRAWGELPIPYPVSNSNAPHSPQIKCIQTDPPELPSSKYRWIMFGSNRLQNALMKEFDANLIASCLRISAAKSSCCCINSFQRILISP